MDRKMDSCTRLMQSVYRLQQQQRQQQQQLIDQQELEKRFDLASQTSVTPEPQILPVQIFQSSSSPSELSPTNTTTPRTRF